MTARRARRNQASSLTTQKPYLALDSYHQTYLIDLSAQNQGTHVLLMPAFRTDHRQVSRVPEIGETLDPMIVVHQADSVTTTTMDLSTLLHIHDIRNTRNQVANEEKDLVVKNTIQHQDIHHKIDAISRHCVRMGL